MAFDVTSSMNSAILSSVMGVQKASEGITLASLGIAQQTTSQRSTSELLSDVALQQIGSTSKLLPSGGDSITQNLVSLSNNLTNAQASLNVLDVADETVGRLIDTLA